MLPKYTGDIDWNDDWYVYEVNGEIFIVLDGLGGWAPSNAKMISYHENGNGTATAVFECERWYDGEIFNAERLCSETKKVDCRLKNIKENDDDVLYV